MSREPVELRFAWQKEDGTHIQSGIYVFDMCTIQDVIDLAKKSKDVPDWVEISIEKEVK